MKRDDDFIRSLMIEAEQALTWHITVPRRVKPSPEEQKRKHHILLLCDAGLFTQSSNGVFRLTNSGHDWLDAVRDDTIWAKTKEAAAKVGGVSLQLLGSIALSYVKKKLSDNGIPLD